jgi:hypothetical protein
LTSQSHSQALYYATHKEEFKYRQNKRKSELPEYNTLYTQQRKEDWLQKLKEDPALLKVSLKVSLPLNMQDLEVFFKISEPSDWYNISRKDLRENDTMRAILPFIKFSDFLKAVYPNHYWLEGHFERVRITLFYF